MIEEAKTGKVIFSIEEEVEKVREWIDRQNFWLLGDELDEIEAHLDTAKDLFYEFVREHNIKVGGN